MTDLRFAFRQLLKSPGFTLLAVLTLALGIGLNTAIFSLINDLFLRPLPFKEPGRLVHLLEGSSERDFEDFPLSAPRFMQYREGQTIFDGFAAENPSGLTLTGMGEPVRIPAFRATWNYFDVLGVKPIRGRTFSPQEEEGADVALVTENFWKKRLGSDPNVLGRTINLDGTPHTIVGVLPNMPAAWSGAQTEIWTTKPFVIPGFSHERMMRGTGFLRTIGRLKPGVTIEQARAAMPALAKSYQTQFPEKIEADLQTRLVPLPEDVSERLRPAFGTLLAAVGFVLLIACSNVANLLLVRFSGRRREIALRMALGASRGGVLRLFVLESMLVSIFAGLLGALVAWQLVPLVPRIAQDLLPLEPSAGTTLSLPVLAFAIALSLITGLAMGFYPAWQSSRADLVDGLKEGGRGSSGSARQHRFRKILVGAQVALSMTLLAGAALLITSFIHLSRQELGFQPENVWVAFITLPEGRYPDLPARERLAERIQEVLRPLPGFEDVAVASDVPLTGGAGATLYTRPEGNVLPISKRPGAPLHDVTPSYFRTLGIPVIAGRAFTERDVAGQPHVMLISQAGARKVFGSENPIGRTLLVTNNSTPTEIIGIVADVRSVELQKQNAMEFYVPWAQENFTFLTIAVRSDLKPEAVTNLVQKAMNAVDPMLALDVPGPMARWVAQAMGQARLMMTLLGLFAVVALLLATIGIYGAVAYTVEQRTGEIGVRMALGAQTIDVVRLVVRQGMQPVLLGLLAGVLAIIALGRLLATQLYQTSTHNPLLLATTAFALALAALLACLVPARRATYLDPVQALRAE